MYIVFDLETTGLPERARKASGSEYYSPSMLDKYEKARIVQIAYIGINHNFDKICQGEYKVKNVDLLDSTKYHGITYDILEREGISFDNIVEGIKEHFTDCEGFIAHNAEFDMNILRSELIRRQYIEFANVLYNKQLICSMKTFMNNVGIHNKYGIKYPSLTELYKFTFGQDTIIENAHDAMVDTLALVECLKQIKLQKDINILDL